MNRSTRPSRLLSRPLVRLAVGFLVLFGLAAPVKAADEINTGYFGNVAIQGYDPVAYFTKAKAMEGSEDHTLKWLGAYWRFANEEHRRLFAANPQSYAPQYGGQCATGMAVHGGLTKDIDPQAWVIIDNKLYLNYSKVTLKLLTDNVVSLEKADASWEKARTAKQ